MDIKILGPGCNNCKTLEQRTRTALQELGLDAAIEKVTDYPSILAHGATSTPGLVVNGRLLIAGRVPTLSEIKEAILGA
ncbi:MAG: thioredoxin family protein [Deinococcales bacterium]